jgi:hypothetical protein
MYSWYTDTSGNGSVSGDRAKAAVQGSATG